MNTRRIYSLDLLKFICAILIMIGHFQGETHLIWPIDLRSCAKFSSGNTVQLFFMISGFFAACNIKNIRECSYKDYIFHKIKRILPMATIATAFCLLVNFIYLVLYRHYIYNTQLGIWTILNSFTLTYSGGSFVFENGGINGQLWYICVLLICYSFFYFSLWLKDKLNIKENTIFVVSIFIFLGIYEYGINLPFLNNTTSINYSCFLIGVLINKLYCYLTTNNKSFNIAFIISAAVFCVCCILGIYRFDIFFDQPILIYSVVVFPTVMIMFLYLNDHIQFEPVKYLGFLSFEIYIWHTSFINLLMCLEKIVPSLFANGYSILHEIIYIIFVIAFSIFAYNFVEKPITKIFYKQ